MYPRRNNQGLSAAHLWQESRPVMKSLISPSPPPLSPHLHLLLLFSISLLLFPFALFFFFNGPSILYPRSVTRPCNSTTRLWVAHTRRERRREPVGAADLWRALHFRLTCSLFGTSPPHPPTPRPWAMWLSDDGELKACGPSLRLNNSPATPQ